MLKINILDKQHQLIQSYEVSSPDEEVFIGKEDGMQIKLDDLSISRKHCSFFFSGGKMYIRNQKSRNGVLINGDRLKKEIQEIEGHEELVVGDFQIKIEKDDAFFRESTAGVKHQSKILKAVYSILFGIIGFMVMLVLFQVSPMPEAKIGPVEPISRLSLVKDDAELNVPAWVPKLYEAKKLYFNNQILAAAKVFQEVLKANPDQKEALTYSLQIRQEMIPKLERQIQSYLEDRNVLGCAKTVAELTILDPQNQWIEKSANLLEGYEKFKEIENLEAKHQFKLAYEKILNVVLIDEETLAAYKQKLYREVRITELFNEAMNLYKSGPVDKVSSVLRSFVRLETLQKPLQEVCNQKIKLLNQWQSFEKMEKKDPIDRLMFGINLLYALDPSEDKLVYDTFIGKMEELKKICGPGQNFYTLLLEDYKAQIMQAREYKLIHEVRDAASNYRDAVKSIRVLAYLSDEDDKDQERKQLEEEIKKYRQQLLAKSKELWAAREFDSAEAIKKYMKWLVIHNTETQSKREMLNLLPGSDEEAVYNQHFPLK